MAFVINFLKNFSIYPSTLILILFCYQFSLSFGGTEYATYTHDSYNLDTQIYTFAGRTDCFYHYIFARHMLHFSYHVIRGGDRVIGASVKNPEGQFILGPVWNNNGSYHSEEVPTSGYYEFCIDNQYSKMSDKLVSIYLSSFNKNDWEQYAAEIETLELSVANTTASLSNVETRINEMFKYLFVSRNLEAVDDELLQSNNYYVSFFSGLQCAIIIIGGFVHVTILKSLFKEQGPQTAKIQVRI